SVRKSRASAASSSVTHLPRVFCKRTAISAAAALVKVRHWMRSGFAPASIRRNSLSVSSLVLPDPADAPTNAETAGSDAASCSALARSRGDSAPSSCEEAATAPQPPTLTSHPPPPPTPPPGRGAHHSQNPARHPA